jgi:hypothetical protein
MANRLTKTAVASSNAQQVNPTRVVQKPVKETAEFDNSASSENKPAEVSEKKNGINLTLVPPRQQPAPQKIKTAATENIITKDEPKEKESKQDLQSLTLQPDTSFATPRTDTETNETEQKPVQALLIEDSATDVAKGQMKKTTFLELLRAEITRTIEPVLATAGQTTKDCPYMNYWLDLYHQKDAIHIEQTVRKYAPGSIGAKTAEEYISVITQRALRAAVIWAKTGRLTGIPPGVPTTLPGQAPTRSRRAVLTKAKTGGARVTDPHAIQEQLGEGQPLSSHVRSRMETAFGTSFQHVRSHTDSTAGALANSVNARAFTVGNHVAFGAGEYRPGTIIGDALIAHELAHVMQQQSAATSIDKMDTSAADYNTLEQDADRSAANVVSSLWSDAPNGRQSGAQNVVSNLRTGLRLQACCSQPTLPQQTMKNLTVDMIKMRGSSRNPSDDLAKANTIFHNASVNFTAGRNETVPDATSDLWIGDTDMVAQTVCGTLSTEEKAMYDGATTLYTLGSRMRVFYVATMSGTDALAYSIPPYCAIGSAAPYVNHAVIKNDALPDTMAHEFGHILLNNGLHHGIDNPTDSCNIMWAGTRTGSVIDASQANIIYTNA